ncbi:DUF7479 domain-containing protein [Methanolobus halotolerans]|uniref:DUF7479 domain-containing protein n=1 Tax=Methanolobus halotolerans TaxID=2052935 RepID=A0A4E0PUS0_9EURY|nr:hypothetical protein [Methanolobus halotolerans]TGC08724.1 hypothetical protein CUN85_08620 [Methanolobus halotolerans]
MDIKITEELDNLLKDNGMKKEEIQEMIDNAESSETKLEARDGDISIAKGVSDNLTMYAVYSPSELVNVYAHKMKILGLTGGELDDIEYDDTSDWVCAKCGEIALERNVDMTYMGVTRPGPGIVCPKCNEFYISDGVAKTLKTAESILEEKRA